MDNNYQSLWKRKKFTVDMGPNFERKEVNGVVIDYFGIWKPDDCPKCKQYHLTHLPTGFLVMANKNLHKLKTVGLISLDALGDALKFDVDNPAPMELKDRWKKLLDSLGRKPHGGPIGRQPWIQDTKKET